MQKFKMVLLSGLCFPGFISSLHATPLFLYSSEFNDRQNIAPVFTCEGKNISPALQWDHVPAKTKTFVLTVSDPDAPSGTFYHWVLFNIPKTVLSLAKNVSPLPAGTQAGRNSWNKAEYNGPCPPRGSSHHYIFTLYALDTKLPLQEGAEINEVQNAMKNHILALAEWKTTFSR